MILKAINLEKEYIADGREKKIKNENFAEKFFDEHAA